MTRQRFCPTCDRSFDDGEAVLKCSVCGLLHHPGCWVKSEGCNTGCEDSVPEPLAYSLPARSITPHPAEGTRVAGAGPTPRYSRPEEPRDPLERVTPVVREQSTQSAGTEEPPTDDEPIIGRPRPNAGGSAQPTPGPGPSAPPRAKRGRYPGEQRKTPSVEDMRLYGRRGMLRYWYVPLAAILAIAVAVGVVWAADQYLGGTDDTPAAADDGNGDDAAAPDDDGQAVAPAPTPEPEPTPVEEEEPIPTEFGPGVFGVVTGTGAGGCLNIRVAPGTENDAIICVPDGTELTVISGPEEAGNLVWWEISAVEITGWAAEDYMAIDESRYVDDGNGGTEAE